MFNFHKKPRPKTILLNSYSVLTGDQLTVSAAWQLRHASSNLAQVLGQAVTPATDDTLDIALTRYMNTRALPLSPYAPVHTFTFSHDIGISGAVRHHGENYQIAIKGIPERVLEHCNMSDNEREAVLMQLQAMSATGLYVIALAGATTQRSIKRISDLKMNEKLTFVGLVGLQLGITGSARQCIASAKEQGIVLYLATALHPAATYHLASQISLATLPQDVYDASHLDTLQPEELISLVTGPNAFARTTPEQKQRLLSTLRTIDETAVAVNTIGEFQKLLAN